MKKCFFTISAILFLALCVRAQTPVEKHGQLRVQGNRIVDKNGNAVQLKGMSLFWSQWIGKYWNKSTVQWLRDDWCVSVIRAAMAADSNSKSPANGGYAQSPEKALSEKNKVITIVDAAIELGIYVIIDYHSHKANLPVNREAAKQFFAEMSERYKDVPNVLYEPWNEPTTQSWKNEIKPYHEEILGVIRKNDPDNIVICGTRQWSQLVDEATAGADTVRGTNIAYTLHFYAGTHKETLRSIARTALNRNKAIFVTEYGTCDASGNTKFDTTETNRWYQFMDENKISHCNWSVADKVETASILTPNAPTTGNWSMSQLTESGRFVRKHLRKNCEFAITGLGDEAPLNSRVTLYPNPFTKNITISAKGSFLYSVSDMAGNMIDQGTAYHQGTFGENFAPGLYIVKVRQEDEEAYFKVTKE